MNLTEGDITPNLRHVNSDVFYTPLRSLCAAAIFGAVVVTQLLMRTCYDEFTVYCTVMAFQCNWCLYIHMVTHTGCLIVTTWNKGDVASNCHEFALVDTQQSF